MRAERIKQVLKNSVYRTIGETAAAIGANGNGHRSLRVLMYHKVNDLPGDPLPLPHEERLAAQGILNRTIDWDEVAELERQGIRIESHGISHRPLADLEVDEAAREIALSKFQLEERLRRPVRAFSYVNGSEAHYKPVHLSLVRQAGYDVAFTAGFRGKPPPPDPLPRGRDNNQPHPPRALEV